MGRWIRIKLALNIYIYTFLISIYFYFYIYILIYFLGKHLLPFAAGAEDGWGTRVPTLGTANLLSALTWQLQEGSWVLAAAPAPEASRDGGHGAASPPWHRQTVFASTAREGDSLRARPP